MAQVSKLILEFASVHLIPYIHQVTHRKLNKSALNAFEQRVAKINDEDEYDVESTYNALRGFILNTPEKVYQSTCQMSDDELINLLTNFDAFNTWISCQIISLSKFAFEKNKAHNSVSLCIDEKKIKALLGFVPQMFCDYPYKSVMFSGTVDESNMPSTGWLKVNLHSEHGTTIVLYNGSFSNGLLDGLCVRLFKNAEHCTSYGTLPKCVQFPECWTHLPFKLTHFCWGFYEGGRWAHGLEHFPLTNVMGCTFASKDVVFRAIVDKGIMQMNSTIIWWRPVKTIDEMLMHMALRYLCTAECKHVEPYMPMQIRNLHMSLTKKEAQLLALFATQLSSYTDQFVSLVSAFFHFCKCTRPLPDNWRVTNKTGKLIGKMKSVYKYYRKHIHFGYRGIWFSRMIRRWRACAKYVCKSRQRKQSLSLALTHFRRMKHSLCKFFFKLFRNALISKSFRVWNKCHYGRRNTKKSVFTLWKQVTLRNIVTRFLIAGRRALAAPMQVHWYDFPCVFVRDYPRNKYDGRLEENLFPGYVSKKHRNRWWFGNH